MGKRLRRCRAHGRRAVRWAKRFLEVAGHFKHRGVRVSHPGVMVDQPGVATAIDEAIDVARRRQIPEETIAALLERIVVSYRARPIAVPGGWVQHRAAWTGGLEAFEKGVAEIQYDEKALTRTRVAVAALLVAEGDPSLRVVDEDIDEELAHAG